MVNSEAAVLPDSLDHRMELAICGGWAGAWLSKELGEVIMTD